MGPLSRTAATLRFFSDDLNPAELTRRLGQQPTVGVAKGGTWVTELGAEKVSLRGAWRLEAPERNDGNLDAQIRGLLDPLSSDLANWEDLTNRFQADIFLGLFLENGNEGVTLQPNTLAAMGLRNLALNFDIYGPEEGD